MLLLNTFKYSSRLVKDFNINTSLMFLKKINPICIALVYVSITGLNENIRVNTNAGKVEIPEHAINHVRLLHRRSDLIIDLTILNTM